MDPLACWKRLLTAFKDCDFEEAGYAADDLRMWFMRGGFRPIEIPNSVNPSSLYAFEMLCRSLVTECDTLDSVCAIPTRDNSYSRDDRWGLADSKEERDAILAFKENRKKSLSE